ncbi:MAG: phosphoenolpyruvate synthase [Bacteroidetes bacterium GWE2_41_25]|nr:MAG: phosphoenolpyruvate synthase [Bacteroidetes bacterium GWA2_40_15]OFX98297.1 MAG: phosphoenolpyruvate synthase [Bacteroidetes bacterium GWC2_40_22]OFY11423.1 MAG: phosphoenolpyruvate synthase [Bacteroidetes bacterium GWE2_41_25]OFY61824.1 MAG: phosphoenolpyruvate synthase [Bacteroidetes bacterium GWF2_41_9]HBH85599.1 phosphoenolpyruvate synthase [Bacteroidales bacterium]
MTFIDGILDIQKYDFTDTSFDLLMQKRIHRVLVICSNYDNYMLEEDGRIDEQIFNEYASLNLRYPPTFVQTDNEEDAFTILNDGNIDLVISMLSLKGSDVFGLAKRIKSKYENIPIVVLTYFSREVSIRLEGEDLSAIDYVFCWLGDASLILAIIKLIEDKMNAEHDIENIGVQAIILVENSIRYISLYLPNIYRIILMQSLDFQREALNEHQRMLKMRGRPKILLASNFNDALDLYYKYKYNVLGVISDISYKRDGIPDENAGIELCKSVMADDDKVPFLLQSSSTTHRKIAEELGAGFINKYSKSLSLELRNFIIQNLAFGPFVFKNPDTMEPIAIATDLQSLQQKLLTIPDNSLEYHASRNHFSKWLNARALFPVAQMFKYIRKEDFGTMDEMRRFLYVAISSFRLGKGRGVIAKFDKTSFDEYHIFSRIGEGSIGGKARGLAFINRIIKNNKLFNRFHDVVITIPRTVVLSTDIFDEFMEQNNLYNVALSDLTDNEILNRFISAELPGHVYQDFYAFLAVSRNFPIAVRSSSKLEDSHYQPFAGIYSTYMIPRLPDNKFMIKMLSDAIKEVYASVYYKSSKTYMTATSNVIDEEKMGIILQEVCGTRHGDIYYPTLSGVARSINYYPIGSEKAADGIVNMAFGLGKLIVEGGLSLRFSPKYPKKILQLSSPEAALRDTQKVFCALDLNVNSFVPSTDDGVNILKLDIKDANNDAAMKYVSSTYDRVNNVLRDGIVHKGKRVITFSGILQHKTFPLAEILSTLLELGQKEMNNPVEIEFAANLETPPGSPKIFSFLQIRPIVHTEEAVNINLGHIKQENTIVFSESALGNGVFKGIQDLVYIKPDSFSSVNNSNVALEIEKINSEFVKNAVGYVLIGPGRWGSTDPWLGIPVKWAQISAARIIIESGLKNYRIDPSQGTHFFQNLTSFRVGYFTINPYINEGFYDVGFLNNLDAVYEDIYLRHVRFENPLEIMIDGRKHKGVILKP